MRAEFALFGFEMQRIDLKICFTTLGKVAVVFDLIRSVALNILRALSSTSKCSMFPLLVGLVSENTRIYICALNSSNIAFHIKELINKSFGK